MHERIDPPSGQTKAYRPLADYGLIGDCHSAALVSRDGTIDWLCVPRFDSPSLFGALLDRDRGGHFTLQPVGSFDSEPAYLEASGVLAIAFRQGTNQAGLVDFMPLQAGRLDRPQSKIHAPRRLVRLLTVERGEMRFRLDYQPRPGYGETPPRLRVTPVGVTMEHGVGPWLRTSLPLVLAEGAAGAGAEFVLQAGQQAAFILEIAYGEDEPCQPVVDEALGCLESTLAYWRGWSAGTAYEGPYHREVMRSLVTLKLLTYAPTGAMVAAPTTSLPESIGGERNWDYRYTWIRDASFAAYALFEGGHVEDGERFVEWVTAFACRRSNLQVLYGVGGERSLAERTLPFLEGYMGSRPVRVGNLASEQFQLDVYGELLDCFHTFRELGQPDRALVESLWPDYCAQVDVVAERWREPDSGIWEVRSAPRHFVYSKVMAWVALDRGIRAAEDLGLSADVERWRTERAAVKAQVLEQGYDETLGAFKSAYDNPALDAANLLLPLVHFIDASDPRMTSTIRATERGLLKDGLVYRYLDVADGLSGNEAAFGICTFWLVECLTAQGRLDEARALFEQTCARATPLGLFAEEQEPGSGLQVGNFPQAFSHIGLVNAAVNLARAGAGGASRAMKHGRAGRSPASDLR